MSELSAREDVGHAVGGPRPPLDSVGVPEGSAGELLVRLAVLERRVRVVLAARRAADANPDDPHRGLYVTDDRVDALLQGRRPPTASHHDPALAQPSSGNVVSLDAPSLVTGGRLAGVKERFGLDDVDLDLLLLAMAPDLDTRFEPIYGYLNDDVTRRRASVALALELCGCDPADPASRRRLGPGSALVGRRLVVLEDPDRPLLSRALRVPDTVTAWLLGDDVLDEAVAEVVVPAVTAPVADDGDVKRAIAAGVRLLYLRDTLESAAWSYVAGALRQLGLPVIGVDLRLAAPGADLAELARLAARAADLRCGAVMVAHLDEVGGRSALDARAWTALAEHTIVAIVGTANWDATWSSMPPLLLAPPELMASQRQAVWGSALDGELSDTNWRAVAAFRLNPEQVTLAARSAAQAGVAAGRDTSAGDLQRGARAQNAASLERLARRIEPRVRWPDLVVPSEVAEELHSITARVRQRSRVLGDWNVGGAAAKGRGVTALFSGDSGTGKTLSAEVVAGDLGLDLYVIDLSTVVDKYIGETEKNLDRIFTEAERINGVLLFDEADAIFGKRSEVSDAKDRYANVEVAYLLQRMERFIGVAILTTNLRANVDEAFLRRIDVLVDFPMPDETSRRALWAQQCGTSLPLDPDIDFEFLARKFRLTGGNIRNIVLGAAYLAADAQRDVAMVDLVQATAREYRKLGRLCLESEFGPYHHLVAGPSW